MAFLHLLYLAIVLLLPGIPLAETITGRKRPGSLLLRALPLGTALTIVTLQYGVRWGIPMQVAAVPLYVSAIIGAWRLWRHYRIARETWTITETAPLIALAVLLGLFSLLPQSSPHGKYYGRAWGDQLNYTLTANYFLSAPHTPNQHVSQPQLRVVAESGLLQSRIGQSVLHAWLTWVLGTRDASFTFFYCCVLAMAVWFASVYLICGQLGCSPGQSTITAALSSGLPCLNTIYLESFLSQLLGTVLVVALIPLLAGRRGRWYSRCLLSGLLVAAILSVYYEFLLVVVVLGGVLSFWRWRMARNPIYGVQPFAAVCAGLMLYYPSSSVALKTMLGVGVQPAGFEKFFPWAFHFEGLSRLWIGDIAPALTLGQNLLVGSAVAVATCAALWQLARCAWVARQGAAAGVLALLLLPIGLCTLPQDRPYQFYKLLQSFWALILISLYIRPTPQISENEPAKRNRKAEGMGKHTSGGSAREELLKPPAAVVPARRWRNIVVAAAVAGCLSSAVMLWRERGLEETPRSGLNAYLASYSGADVAVLLRRASDHLFVVDLSPRSFNDRLAQGWLVLFSALVKPDIEMMWTAVGDQSAHPTGPAAFPSDPSYDADTHMLPQRLLASLADLTVVQRGASFLRPDKSLWERVASDGVTTLYRPAIGYFLFPTCVHQRQYVSFGALDTSVTVRSAPENYLRLDFASSKDLPNGLDLVISHESPPDFGRIVWHCYDNSPAGQYVPMGAGVSVLRTGPVKRGVREVFLGPLYQGDAGGTPARPIEVKITRIVYRPHSES